MRRRRRRPIQANPLPAMEFLLQLISTPRRSPLVEEVYGSHLSMDLLDNRRRRLSGKWKSRHRHPLGQTCGTIRNRRAWMDDGRARPSCLQNGCTLVVKEKINTKRSPNAAKLFGDFFWTRKHLLGQRSIRGGAPRGAQPTRGAWAQARPGGLSHFDGLPHRLFAL